MTSGNFLKRSIPLVPLSNAHTLLYQSLNLEKCDGRAVKVLVRLTIRGYSLVWGEEGIMQDRGVCLERGMGRVGSLYV